MLISRHRVIEYIRIALRALKHHAHYTAEWISHASPPYTPAAPPSTQHKLVRNHKRIDHYKRYYRTPTVSPRPSPHPPRSSPSSLPRLPLPTPPSSTSLPSPIPKPPIPPLQEKLQKKELTPHQRPHTPNQIHQFPLHAHTLVRTCTAAECRLRGRVAPSYCGGVGVVSGCV